MEKFRQLAVDGERFPLLKPSDYRDARLLAANTAEAHTVPTGANWCVVIPNADVYIKASAATVPGDVTDGTAPMFCPAGAARPFYVGANSPFVSAGAFSIISPQTCVASLEFFE